MSIPINVSAMYGLFSISHSFMFACDFLALIYRTAVFYKPQYFLTHIFVFHYVTYVDALRMLMEKYRESQRELHCVL